MAKQPFPDELPSFWRKFWIKGGITLAIFVALAVAGTMAYRRWEPSRLAGKARVAFEKGDYPGAILTARRALQINPASRPASQIMAEITMKLQAPDAVDWRRRLAELSPGSSPEALAWAQAALEMRRPVSARQALASLPEAERNTARYHSMAGLAALNSGHPREAEKHLAEAVRIEPASELHRYNLAVFQIQSPDPAVRKTGAETLDVLSRGGRVEVLARRAAVQQLVNDQAFEEALRVSGELVRHAGAEFADRMAHLDLLQRLQRPELTGFLGEVQAKARTEKPENAGALINWMRLHGRNSEALRWAETLDVKLAEHGRVGIARAESLIAEKEWPRLREFLEKASWADLEPVRLAYLARALREQGDLPSSRARWTAAVTAAARSRDQATQLALIASRWDWQPELRDTLHAAAGMPAGQWALQMLHRLYLADGDTSGLLRIAQRFTELDPASEAARNNVALLSLLLRRDLPKATEAARQLHASAPANAAFATTWALALHLAGRSGEGLSVLRSLRPEQLREPSAAAYYGVLLSANGSKGEAAEYLELAKQAPLLPEEEALVAAAR